MTTGRNPILKECMRLIAAAPAPSVEAPVGMPCEIAEADFEAGTVTLKMNGAYEVRTGLHYLVPAGAPAPAEVPMPESDSECTHADDHIYPVWREDQMRTYGDAREAAGYARGLKEAEAKITSSLAATVECEMFETVIYPTIDAALRGEVK